ncbi:hypothetical protein B0H12DRAFT_82447 [Mycena haematopus]|nr:hypothetical protein B0H12DRAFT_82447 [Mycena haematopus]
MLWKIPCLVPWTIVKQAAVKYKSYSNFVSMLYIIWLIYSLLSRRTHPTRVILDMSFHSVWSPVFDVFDPDNPRHIALLFHLMSVATSSDTIFALRHLNSRLLRLPPEIIAEIFQICVAPDVNADGVVDTWKCPWVLGQICSYLRTVALSIPRLWCNIVIVLKHPSASKNLVRRLEVLLERSGSCPLTLVVRSDSTCALDLRSHPALAVLMETSGRWEDIDFCLPPLLLSSLTTIQGHLGCLRALKIYPAQRPSRYYPHLVIDAFKIAPLLDTVQVRNDSDITILLPSEQIRYYRSTCNDLPQLSRILNGMRNLVVCYLEPVFESGLSVSEQIHLPNLRTLQIGVDSNFGYCYDHRAALLDSFTVPALRILSIRCHKNDRFIIPNLIAMANRSLCRLKKVSVEMPTAIPLDILAFLQCTPTLTHLTLKGEFLMPGIVQGLTHVTNSIHALLPALQTLVIHVDFLDSEVVDLVRSRTNPNFILDGTPDVCKLRIKKPPRIDDATFDSLFEGDGLDPYLTKAMI